MLNIYFNLDRRSGIPIYIQVKQQIKNFIQQGIWEKGHKLPPERQLAEKLKVSRNTISAAYKELEIEGYLSSHQGRGTFVAYTNSRFQRHPSQDKLIKIIDKAMEETLQNGFDLDEFIVMCHTRAQEKKNVLSNLKVAFIECNHEQLDYFSKEIELGAGISILPVLLEDLKKDPKAFSVNFKDVDIIVTTFFHIEEVRSLLADGNKEILGIALDPQVETLVKIARIPKNKRIGVVCISNNFAQKVLQSIENAGIELPDIKISISKKIEELMEFVKDLDVIIASPSRKKELIELVNPEKEIIEFIYLPDLGSINMLKTAIFHLRKK
jgi:GntR family transcriptional regulator